MRLAGKPASYPDVILLLANDIQKNQILVASIFQGMLIALASDSNVACLDWGHLAIRICKRAFAGHYDISVLVYLMLVHTD